MGVFTYRLAPRSENYEILTPGQDYRFGLNLGRVGSSANMQAWSIHAQASARVDVQCYIANILKRPFDEYTDNRGWLAPAPNPDVGDLWVPCTSIPNFSVTPEGIYFQQGEFTDTAQFLMFHLMPQFPATSDKKTDTAGNPVETVALQLAVTFR